MFLCNTLWTFYCLKFLPSSGKWFNLMTHLIKKNGGILSYTQFHKEPPMSLAQWLSNSLHHHQMPSLRQPLQTYKKTTHKHPRSLPLFSLSFSVPACSALASFPLLSSSLPFFYSSFFPIFLFLSFSSTLHALLLSLFESPCLPPIILYAVPIAWLDSSGHLGPNKVLPPDTLCCIIKHNKYVVLSISTI